MTFICFFFLINHIFHFSLIGKHVLEAEQAISYTSKDSEESMSKLI